MGLKLNGRYISLILAVQIAYLVQAVRAAGKCDAVFKGFSDCLLKLGDSMANYPQGLDDKTNIKTVCTYWEDFHSCTVTALTDCQEGAKDMWDKLRKESKNPSAPGVSLGSFSNLAFLLSAGPAPPARPPTLTPCSRKSRGRSIRSLGTL
uniref:Neuritin 1 n=1 Tax=Rousettus aegyptiacus TaxID=9407 RepID=A0A7J8KDH0_ROUAE|nr:neuritin 1 [Rousettus aegyptiacus]